jgi:hypothetical protein
VLGQSSLDELLGGREKISEKLQAIIDRQTEPWGIKVGTVELKDAQLAESMVRALARQAEAEREKRAKIIATEGEFQAAQVLANAAEIISTQPAALALRYMQTLLDMGSNQNSTIVFPISIELIRRPSVQRSAKVDSDHRADSTMPSTCKDLPPAEINGAPFAWSVTSLPWQSDRSHDADGVCCEGGVPWQAPQRACAPDASFQSGTAAGSASFAPWQATFVHWLPLQTGSAPLDVARPEKTTCTVPSRWTGSRIVAGTTWQLEQATGSVRVGLSCAGCAAVLGQGLSPTP